MGRDDFVDTAVDGMIIHVLKPIFQEQVMRT
jgi:hypothetical protein